MNDSKPDETKNELASLNFRRRLLDELEVRQSKNKRFSLRAFAFFLGIDASTLKKILDGKRPLGPRTIRKLGKKIGLTIPEIEAYVTTHKRRRKIGFSLEDDRRQMAYRVLKPEEARLIANPLSYAVLELLKVREFDLSPNSIAGSLKISNQEAENLLEALKEHQWIKQTPQGDWISAVGNTTVDPLDEKTKAARLELMDAIINRSRQAFHEIPKELRAHSANTFAIDTSRLPEVIAKIKALSRELEQFAISESKDPNAIYQVQIGLFPISKV